MLDFAQVCKAGVTRVRKIWLTRHGESEYNKRALIGGNSVLSTTGAAYASLLPDAIIDRIPQARRRPINSKANPLATYSYSLVAWG